MQRVAEEEPQGPTFLRQALLEAGIAAASFRPPGGARWLLVKGGDEVPRKLL
jgi:hypothetical protein